MFNNVQEPSPVEAAKLEVTKLFEAERGIEDRRRQAYVALAGIEAGAGQAVADGGSIEDASRQIVQGQAEIRVLEQGIQITRQRRLSAIRRRLEIEGRELRAGAEAKRKEAGELLRKCEPLLAKLGALQFVKYGPAILLAERTGTWADSIVSGKPLDRCNPLEAMRDLDGRFVVPRSEELLTQADALEQAAAQLEEREVLVNGMVERPTLDDVLSEEHFTNAEILAPARHVVEGWAAAVENRIKRERPDLASGKLRRMYRLSWHNGNLDFPNCSVTFVGANYSCGDPVFTVGAAA
jgi:hypothetical protein